MKATYAIGALLILLMLSACTTPSPAQPPTASREALLDWHSATIILPLDQYGMSLSEALVVEAAGGLEFAQCVGQTVGYPQAAVEEARRYIGSTPMANHWRYGFWDVDYIAQYGYRGVQDDPLKLFIGPSDETNLACFEQMRGMDLVPLAADYVIGSGGEPLGLGSQQSYEQTLADPAFLSLQTRWRACVSQAGYIIETESDSNAAKTDPSWTEAQVLQAALADATCADSMSYAQQVASIEAESQFEYITEHEAELVQVKQMANERIAKATQILRDAGVMCPSRAERPNRPACGFLSCPRRPTGRGSYPTRHSAQEGPGWV